MRKTQMMTMTYESALTKLSVQIHQLQVAFRISVCKYATSGTDLMQELDNIRCDLQYNQICTASFLYGREN